MELSRQDRIEGELASQKANTQSKNAAKRFMASSFSGKFPLRLRCECGNQYCDEIVVVPSKIGWAEQELKPVFVIYPGHEQLDIETIIEKTAGYYMVRKDLPSGS